MKRTLHHLRQITLLLALAGPLLLPATLQAQEGKVYVIEITGEVDLGLAPYVERVFAEAAENNAEAVILQVNTFGGRVDVATQVKDAILSAEMPTIAFVNNRAISAGALITLSADHIAMAPGGSIGAATPVYGDGEKASEKVVSYMRAEMRATAEENGRNPAIAEAMVDEELMLGDSTLKQPGQLLTLTTSEALSVGYCDTEANSLEEALAAFGYEGRVLVKTELSFGEELVRFFTAPFMSSILIMLGLGGLFFTIKTGQIGTVAIIGVTSIGLFFGAQFLADLANFIEVLLFIAGVVLIVVEIFVIPGFGVAGVSGIVLLFTGIFLALIGNFELVTFDSLAVPLYTLAASFIGLGVLTALMVKYLPSAPAFRRFILAGSTVPPAMNEEETTRMSSLVGIRGTVVTTLRPAGTAQIGPERLDVIAEGAFINAGDEVEVVRVEGRKIVVRKID